MWIISTLQNLPTISADRLHVITDLVEGVYQEHAAAAIGQLEVRKEIASELQMIVQPVMPGTLYAILSTCIIWKVGYCFYLLMAEFS